MAKQMAISNDDPRKLRNLLTRVGDLAREHEVRSVVVGLCARTGDSQFPEFVNYLAASLRVEDAIFRMTRERVVLHLADVDIESAAAVLDRLRSEFAEQVPAITDSDFITRYMEVDAQTDDLSVKRVLMSLFTRDGEGAEALH